MRFEIEGNPVEIGAALDALIKAKMAGSVCAPRPSCTAAGEWRPISEMPQNDSWGDWILAREKGGYDYHLFHYYEVDKQKQWASDGTPITHPMFVGLTHFAIVRF